MELTRKLASGFISVSVFYEICLSIRICSIQQLNYNNSVKLVNNKCTLHFLCFFLSFDQVVIEPLLIDEDYYARVEGREIISNLAKAAGLATMISTMRPDIDNIDEYVRNTTARAFAVVASALGMYYPLRFLILTL